jgi:hypothetical protein
MQGTCQCNIENRYRSMSVGMALAPVVALLLLLKQIFFVLVAAGGQPGVERRRLMKRLAASPVIAVFQWGLNLYPASPDAVHSSMASIYRAGTTEDEGGATSDAEAVPQHAVRG